LNEEELVLVREHMTAEPISLPPDASLRDAVVLLRRHQIRHIPILDRALLVGIVSDRDVRRASPSVLSEGEDEYEAVLDRTPLSRIMTREPLTVGPEAPVAEAVRVMVDKKLGALPVVEQGRLVGIITETDALRLLLDLLVPTRRQ
jgi:acetoin utilization protein AcuB